MPLRTPLPLLAVTLLAGILAGCTPPQTTQDTNWRDHVATAQPYDYYFYDIPERDRVGESLDTGVYLLRQVEDDTFVFFDLVWTYDGITTGIDDIRADFSLPAEDDTETENTYIADPIVMSRSEVEQDVQNGVFLYIYRAGEAPEGIPVPDVPADL